RPGSHLPAPALTAPAGVAAGKEIADRGARSGYAARVPARSGGSGATQRHVNIVATIAAVAGILFGYGTGVIAGALLFIRADFGLSPLAQGIVVSAMLLGATAGSGIAGTISDRLGRRTAIVVAGTTFAIGALVSALAPSAA